MLSAARTRLLHVSASLRAGKNLEAAAAAVKTLKSVSNEDKLRLYALYKQATVGANSTPKPGAFDFVGKAKWTAWQGLGSMSKEAAEEEYVKTVAALGAPIGGSSSSSAASSSAGGPGDYPTGHEHIRASLSPARVLTITLSRPDKRNALSLPMYQSVTATLNKAAADDAVAVAVLTGAGSYYSSGNDLAGLAAAAMDSGSGGLPAAAEAGGAVLQAFVSAFIRFPKFLITAVNGPAIGIAVTTLPFADYVVASHKATFHAGFPALGQTPEACSSATFPALMGPGPAAEVLLLGRKLTAGEAKERRLVTEVVEDSQLAARVASLSSAVAALPPQSLRAGKALLRTGWPSASTTTAGEHVTGASGIAFLEAVNASEVTALKARWLHSECMEAVGSFLSSRGHKL